MFINKEYIENTLNINSTYSDVETVIEKSRKNIALNHHDVALLLQANDNESLKLIFDESTRIKRHYYGNRIVLFAPLYVSDFCSNNCSYCGYKRDNKFDRRKLSVEELKEEVKALEKLGHKRLALEVGEDNHNFSFEQILNTIDTIYDNSDIRRININIAPVSVEEFKRLAQKEIGTYILFQETYDQEIYEKNHPMSLKGNYERQLYAHHKAMEAGIEDVGGGVLFGLGDFKQEVLSLVIHNEELESQFNVGFHTVSVPRLQQAQGMDMSQYDLVSDDDFRKIIAIIRIAIPYTGIILSTRETKEMRQELIDLGVTQISAGSQTGVGGYKESDSSLQFETSDERSVLEVMKDLIQRGYLPSYCTACYRMGRVGDHFMQIVKDNKIHLLCHPNSLITFAEYVEDFGDEELKELARELIANELNNIEDETFRKIVSSKIESIRNGERDLYV